MVGSGKWSFYLCERVRLLSGRDHKYMGKYAYSISQTSSNDSQSCCDVCHIYVVTIVHYGHEATDEIVVCTLYENH